MAVPFVARWYHTAGLRRLLLASMALSIVSSIGFIFVFAGTSDWVIRALLLTWGWAFGFSLVSLAAESTRRRRRQ